MTDGSQKSKGKKPRSGAIGAKRGAGTGVRASRDKRPHLVASEIQIGGMPVFIELSDVAVPLREEAAVAAAEFRPEQLVNRLEAAGEVAAATCLRVFERMNAALKSGVHPEEVSLEFGISLGGEAGIPFVAKGKGEATFKVAAKWTLGT